MWIGVALPPGSVVRADLAVWSPGATVGAGLTAPLPPGAVGGSALGTEGPCR
jgi:hypothetical protein